MKSLLALCSVLFAFSAAADCVSDFKAMQDKTKVALKSVRTVSLVSKNDLKKLKPMELKAVKNYMSYLSFSFEDENELEVTTAQYLNKKSNEAIGYKISVTDGGDESNVRYYMKIAVGPSDVSYPILYRAWDNQSPEYKFICEKK